MRGKIAAIRLRLLLRSISVVTASARIIIISRKHQTIQTNGETIVAVYPGVGYEIATTGITYAQGGQ